MSPFAQFLLNRKVKTVILLVLSVLYLAGIVCLFFNTGLGVLLWGAALIPSLLWYFFHRRQELLAEERKAEEAKEAAEGEANE